MDARQWSLGETVKLRDPDKCPRGHRGKVVDSRKRKSGFRRRLHHCEECGLTWASFQTIIDPRRLSRVYSGRRDVMI